MLKVGLVGVGHFGKLHLKALKKIKNIKLIGFYDINPQTSAEVEKHYNVCSFKTYKKLIEECDVIDIVTPTSEHYNCAYEAIKAQKHFFIEKPLTDDLKTAEKLIELAYEAGVKAQVGHIERFNPAFLAVEDIICKPKYIEAIRLQPFLKRSLDVSVILNLMIHDIDLIQEIVKSKIRKIYASGAKVVTDSIDLANARLEFENGCIAHLSTSRIANKNQRMIKIFQKNKCIILDLFSKKVEILEAFLTKNQNKTETNLVTHQPQVQQIDSIEAELVSFFDSIINNQKPKVTLEDGFYALKTAFTINEIILKNSY